jgi:hypothetical protein
LKKVGKSLQTLSPAHALFVLSLSHWRRIATLSDPTSVWGQQGHRSWEEGIRAEVYHGQSLTSMSCIEPVLVPSSCHCETQKLSKTPKNDIGNDSVVCYSAAAVPRLCISVRAPHPSVGHVRSGSLSGTCQLSRKFVGRIMLCGRNRCPQ